MWPQLLALGSLALPSLAFSDDCHGARTSGNFSVEQVAWFCDREEAMANGASHPPTLTPHQWTYLQSLAVPLRELRKPTRRRVKRQTSGMLVRKEYRMLSDEERQRLHAAMNRLKKDFVDGKSKWDIFTEIHNPSGARNAHWGPGFLPWHREFLHRVESALREYDPIVALPYWDSTLDAPLPDPSHSMVWTAGFLGNGDGEVRTGPFARWPTHAPFKTKTRGDINTLYRTVGADVRGRLYTESDVDWILSRNHYSELSFCEDKTFERTHGLQHLFVGGFLEPLRLSANDPAFYLIHSFVDLLWEHFRRRRQSPQQREDEWLKPGHQVCKPEHEVFGAMIPFPGMRNGDGMSNKYTDSLYVYAPRPQCVAGTQGGRSHCSSPYLFCDTSLGRCVGKVRPGGTCSGFEAFDVCYQSVCTNGRCERGARESAHKRHQPPVALTRAAQLPATAPFTFAPRTTTSTGPPLQPFPQPCTRVYFKVLVWTPGGPARSASYAVSLRGLNYQAADSTAPLSGGSFPEHAGLAYLSVCRPSSEAPLVEVEVDVRSSGRQCRPFCYYAESQSFGECDGRLKIGRRQHGSDPVAYTHDMDARRVLGASLVGHPGTWSLRPPRLSFLCDGASRPSAVLDFLEEQKPAFTAHSTVWFQTVVLDRREPFRRPVTGATATATDHQEPHFTDSVRIETQSGGAPYHSGAVYLRARNPHYYSEPVRLRLGVAMTTGSGGQCRSVCTARGGESAPCDGELQVRGRRSRRRAGGRRTTPGRCTCGRGTRTTTRSRCASASAWP